MNTMKLKYTQAPGRRTPALARAAAKHPTIIMRAQRRVGTICSHVAAQQHPSAAPARPAACAAAEATAPAAADPPPPPDTRRAVPVGSDGLLAQEHVDAYVRDGFLAVSGLIPPAVLGPAIDCMWRIMDRENRRSWRGPPLPARAQPLDRADPTTWTGAWQGMLTSPEILATFTPTYINVARQLAAANAAASLFPVAPHLPTKPPLTRRNPYAPPTDHGYRTDLGTPEGDPGYPFVLTKQGARQIRRGYPIAIHNFPDPAAVGSPDSPPRSAAEYSPHIDGGGEEDGWRVSPQPVSIQASTILGGAGVSGCGGTLVWPGLHRAMAREYLRDPVKYEWVSALAPRCPELAASEGILPVEAVPEPGDVLFHDFFCGHAGSQNSSAVPRLMFQCRFGTTSSLKGTRHGGNVF